MALAGTENPAPEMSGWVRTNHCIFGDGIGSVQLTSYHLLGMATNEGCEDDYFAATLGSQQWWWGKVSFTISVLVMDNVSDTPIAWRRWMTDIKEGMFIFVWLLKYSSEVRDF